MDVVVPQLKGECFAPPSAMIDEVALRRVDAGMGVGSPSRNPWESEKTLILTWSKASQK